MVIEGMIIKRYLAFILVSGFYFSRKKKENMIAYRVQLIYTSIKDQQAQGLSQELDV